MENFVEGLIFASRWLLAPFFIGLVFAILILLAKFVRTFVNLVWDVLNGSDKDTVIEILTLVDTALIASLLLIIVFSGYENFVSKIGTADHEDRPAWMGKVGFSDLKLKLIGSIVAISAVELLKVFMQTGAADPATLYWKIVIHATFVVSGVLFAVTDYITDLKKR